MTRIQFRSLELLQLNDKAHLPDKSWVCQSVRMRGSVFFANRATLCMNGDGEQSAIYPVRE